MTVLRFLPRFRQAYRSLDALAEREQWARQDIESFQLDRLNTLWRQSIDHVPYYRALASRNALPVRFSDVEHFRSVVPVLSKATVRDCRDQFLSDQAGSGKWVHTSGSTGAVTEVFWAREAHFEMLRCRYRFYVMWGVDIFDRIAYLWGASALGAPGMPGRIAKLRQPIEDRLRNRLRLSAYRLGSADLREHLSRMADFRPVSLYAYSTAGYLLAKEAEEIGFRCDSLKLVSLSAEPAYPYMTETIERVFGVPALAEYGSAECGAIAVEWPDRTLRVREDVTLLETLPRDDGRFDVVVTTLNNPSFPLIRYAIGDVTDAPLHRPAQGFAIIKNVVGRSNDGLLSRSGRLLHTTSIEHMFEHCRAVRRYRVYQHLDGALSVAVELDRPDARVDTKMLERKLKEFTEGYPVRLEVVDAIPQTAAGKHRWIVSDLINVDQTVRPHRESFVSPWR